MLSDIKMLVPRFLPLEDINTDDPVSKHVFKEHFGVDKALSYVSSYLIFRPYSWVR